MGNTHASKHSIEGADGAGTFDKDEPARAQLPDVVSQLLGGAIPVDVAVAPPRCGVRLVLEVCKWAHDTYTCLRRGDVRVVGLQASVRLPNRAAPAANTFQCGQRAAEILRQLSRTWASGTSFEYQRPSPGHASGDMRWHVIKTRS